MNNSHPQQQIIEKEPPPPKTPRPSIYIRTLNIIGAPFKKRYQRHYQQSKTHLIIDLVFILLIVLLIISNLYLLKQKFPLGNLTISFNQKEKNTPTDNNPIKQPSLPSIILQAQAQYYNIEGDQLGLGAWPPKVGESTTLAIQVKISANQNLREIFLKTTLPTNINYLKTSAVNQGSLPFYDQSSKILTWHLDSLNTGDLATAVFNIEFTPHSQDLNQKILLLKNIIVNAINQENEEISTTQNNLFSPLVN